MTKIVLKCPSCGHMIDFGPNWVPVDTSQPITQADRIRSMSDETLARWLDDLLDICYENSCRKCFLKGYSGCGYDNVIKWLKSPAEDDADGQEDSKC